MILGALMSWKRKIRRGCIGTFSTASADRLNFQQVDKFRSMADIFHARSIPLKISPVRLHSGQSMLIFFMKWLATFVAAKSEGDL